MLKDSEIVRALENEIHLAEYVDSDYCSNTEVSLLKSTVDLINRLQKADGKNKDNIRLLQLAIDQKRRKIIRLEEDNQELKAENERLEKEFDIMRFTTAKRWVKEAKAEAYKEFAERLKEKSKKTEIVCSGALITTNYSISDKNFNNLLKELVGEDNAE